MEGLLGGRQNGVKSKNADLVFVKRNPADC